MPERRTQIDVRPGTRITAIRVEPAGEDGRRLDAESWTFIYAPGAGSNLHDPFGAHLCDTLAARGVTAVRFQFPYMEAGRRSPDRTELLEATWRTVIDAVRPEGGKLAVGGRSMGGRVASMVLAQGVKADALALFAYPLHPPGKPKQLRDAHLPSIAAPTLFVSGTNDAFGTPDELRAAASNVKLSTVHVLDGADHGFAVRKSSGRTKQDVFDEAAGALARWLKV
jgi:predicted alpha/beta-hydrolase family hydrolase